MNDEIARRRLEKDSKKVNDEDIKNLLNKESALIRIFKTKAKLKNLFEYFKIFWSIIKDYWNGVYKEIPWWAISAIVAALLYVLSPVDLMPDYIPFVGFIDDAAVMGYCIKLVGKEIEKYKAWKQDHR